MKIARAQTFSPIKTHVIYLGSGLKISVTDIVRPICKIVCRGEKGIGHSIQPFLQPDCTYSMCLWSPLPFRQNCKKVENQRCAIFTISKYNSPQTENKATGHPFKCVRPQSRHRTFCQMRRIPIF
jgi:hypothetical protein